MSPAIVGAGTSETAWRPWLAERDWPPLDVAALARAPRLVVLAAHPDDDVLGVGGLLTLLAARGAQPAMVWATDGEASHPDAAAVTPWWLARRRRGESRAALAALGVPAGDAARLALPDGRLADRERHLYDRLRDMVDRGTAVLAPWRGDGHPDHDACGRVAARVVRAARATLLEYPIWAWHWAVPGDRHVPWRRARRLRLTADAAAAKQWAIACFRSQTQPLGPGREHAAVLPPWVLARFLRGEEVVFA